MITPRTAESKGQPGFTNRFVVDPGSNLQCSQTLQLGSCRLFPFLAYVPGVPITIELPDLKSQTKFNLARWAEVSADPRLANLPDRIETDRHGHILMTPPPAFGHGRRQFSLGNLLSDLLPQGLVITECPLSTADGVKELDVAWLGPGRPELTAE